MNERNLHKRKKHRRKVNKKNVRRTSSSAFADKVRDIWDTVSDLFGRAIAFANENKMVYAIAATVVALIVVVVVGIVRINAVNSSDVELVMVGLDDEGKPVYEERKVPKKKADSKNEEVVEENPTVLAYKTDARNGYMNNCIFLGDSRTVAAVSYGFINDDRALAEVGIAHTSVAKNTFVNNAGQQYTLNSFLESHQMPVVYVNYGVNGMVGANQKDFKKSYADLVDKVSGLCPNSNIVLMGVWPVDDNGTYRGRVSNELINEFNAWLVELAEEKGYHYLDVETALKGSDGQIKPEFDAGDGLHYRASAYNTIIDYVIQHPVPGVSDDGEYVVHYVKPSGAYKKIMTEEPKLPDNVTESTITPSPAPDKNSCHHEFYDWVIDGDKEVRACKFCGLTETRDRQNTEPQPCNHAWGDWVTVKEATTSEAGLRERYCSKCRERQTDPIAKLEAKVTPQAQPTQATPTQAPPEESSSQPAEEPSSSETPPSTPDESDPPETPSDPPPAEDPAAEPGGDV